MIAIHPITSVTRKDDIAYIMSCVQEGHCCSIVGVSNIGKSALLRNLCRPDVQAAYLGQSAGEFIFLYLDFNFMLGTSEQGFYELILRDLIRALEDASVDAPLVERIRDAHAQVVNPSSEFVVPLRFNESLLALGEGLGRQVVFLFDEFDAAFQQLDARIFLNLRALKDRYDQTLSYVTATVYPLPQLRAGRETDEFCELFSHHTHYLAPLNEDDARLYLADRAHLTDPKLEDQDIEFIIRTAGGHPGLLDATYQATIAAKEEARHIRGTNEIHYEAVREKLHGDINVRTECAKLWSDLSEDEQLSLLALVTGIGETTPQAKASLREKHILTDEDQTLSPLFTAFVERQGLARRDRPRGVRLDVEAGDVYVDGELVPALTELEYRLMLLLYGNMDKICDKYSIVEAVWGESYIDQVDDARIEKLIGRLRQKIEPDPLNPKYLITIRGRGYKLVSR